MCTETERIGRKNTKSNKEIEIKIYQYKILVTFYFVRVVQEYTKAKHDELNELWNQKIVIMYRSNKINFWYMFSMFIRAMLRIQNSS